MKYTAFILVFLMSLISVRAEEPHRLEFTRMVAHWSECADTGYLPFIDDAKPELVQVGFYGAHFWSLAFSPLGKGYPANFPLVGLNENGKFFEDLNRQLHKRHIKVVGHFNVEFLVGDPDSPEGPRGFFKFYRDLWNEKELGPKPVANPIDLLEKNADGTPIVNHIYNIGGMAEYWGCLNNPYWREVLKVWVRRGIQRGADGFIANYFYRHDCTCPYCQAAFKEYLSQRFTPEQLKDQFGITDLAHHVFKEIVGWHDPKESTPLRREMLRFSQISTKKAFDEVFVQYGRSLKRDLIVAQWDHLGEFAQLNGDERCMLPADLWGKNEDYLWYSTGGADNSTDLKNGFLGEATLQARYIRGAFDDKPFTLGKYESTRTRVSIAELAANGGAPMGFYTNFKDPMARAEIVRYYRFIARYENLYRANKPYGEAVLIYPRSRGQAGDLAAIDTFKALGRRLLDAHVLFDIRPDDWVTTNQLAAYGRVLTTASANESFPSTNHFSRFDAPWTVRVSASRPAKGPEVDLHFVNYNRIEPATPHSPGTGIQDEKPIAVPEVKTDFVLPPGMRGTRVEAITPESPDPAKLAFESRDGHVVFTMPGFLVYGVARIELKPAR